jgi:hypothetical protein
LRRAAPQTPATSFEEFMRNLERIGPDGPTTRPASPSPNFTPAAQNDFAARMRWSVATSYNAANHPPIVSLLGSTHRSARPGETVRLEGLASDPDGNAVAVRWWRWKAVDTYPGEVTLSDPTARATDLVVPADAVAGQRLQLVLQATDDGRPPLSRYQRVVLSIVR